MSSAEPNHRCPSYRSEHADSVIGVVGTDGRVGFLGSPIAVSDPLIQSLRQSSPGVALESRFRFSGGCREHGCSSWRNDHCGVIEDALGEQGESRVSIGAPLAHCAIRPTCRWWAEHGRKACNACPLVVTASVGQ